MGKLKPVYSEIETGATEILKKPAQTKAEVMKQLGVDKKLWTKLLLYGLVPKPHWTPTLPEYDYRARWNRTDVAQMLEVLDWYRNDGLTLQGCMMRLAHRRQGGQYVGSALELDRWAQEHGMSLAEAARHIRKQVQLGKPAQLHTLHPMSGHLVKKAMPPDERLARLRTELMAVYLQLCCNPLESTPPSPPEAENQ